MPGAHQGTESSHAHAPGGSRGVASGDRDLALALQAQEEALAKARGLAANNFPRPVSPSQVCVQLPTQPAASPFQHQRNASAPQALIRVVPESPFSAQAGTPYHAARRPSVGPAGAGPGPSALATPSQLQVAQDARLAAEMQDAELAAQMQGVELAAVADATGKEHTAHLMFPHMLLSAGSSREQALHRTLSRAPSVRATPHVLSSQLPAEPVVSADRAHLLQQLATYDLVEKQVAGDGNCQFRALSDQLFGSPDHHASVRAAIVDELRHNAPLYSCYVPGDYGIYCTTMARSGTWGDHVTLQAASNLYNMRIVVMSSYAQSPVITIDPNESEDASPTKAAARGVRQSASAGSKPRSSRTLYLSFWAEVHYNSLYPRSEPPLPEAAPGRTTSNPGQGQHADDNPHKFLGSKRLGKVVARATGKR